MVTVRNPNFAVLWLLIGLLFVPLGVGHEVTWEDLVIRLPAAIIVLVDAGLTLQSALLYHRWVWPHRQRVPSRWRFPFFRPAFAWLGALGYYLVAAWVIRAILLAPDMPIIDPHSTGLFIGGYLLIMVWKFAYLVAVGRLARVLDERSS